MYCDQIISKPIFKQPEPCLRWLIFFWGLMVSFHHSPNLLITLCLLLVAGGVQRKRAKPSIRNISLSQFHLLDGVHECFGIPAGLVHGRCYPATERETTVIWPACLWCTKSARLAAFPSFSQYPVALNPNRESGCFALEIEPLCAACPDILYTPFCNGEHFISYIRRGVAYMPIGLWFHGVNQSIDR